MECGPHPQKQLNRNKSTKNNVELMIQCVEKGIEPIENSLKACYYALNASPIINLPSQWKLKLEPNYACNVLPTISAFCNFKTT